MPAKVYTIYRFGFENQNLYEYGQEVYGIIQENPYRLADDISGVGFRIADEIAKKVGILYRFSPQDSV